MKFGRLQLAQARALAFGVTVFFVAIPMMVLAFLALGAGVPIVWLMCGSFSASVVIACAFGRWKYRELVKQYPVGCCRICGYNLTGNVSGRCPECGTATGDTKQR